MKDLTEKTYVDDSRFMEFIDEIATQITEMNFGNDTFNMDEERDELGFTKESKEYYDEVYAEYEMMANNIMGVYKYQDMITHIYPINKIK